MKYLIIVFLFILSNCGVVSGVKATVAYNLSDKFENIETDNQVSLLVMLNPFTKPDVFVRINSQHPRYKNKYTMLYNNNIINLPIHRTFTKKVDDQIYYQYYTLLDSKKLRLINRLAKDRVSNLTIKIDNHLIDDLAGGDEIRRGTAFALRLSQ